MTDAAVTPAVTYSDIVVTRGDLDVTPTPHPWYDVTTNGCRAFYDRAMARNARRMTHRRAIRVTAVLMWRMRRGVTCNQAFR